MKIFLKRRLTLRCGPSFYVKILGSTKFISYFCEMLGRIFCVKPIKTGKNEKNNHISNNCTAYANVVNRTDNIIAVEEV